MARKNSNGSPSSNGNGSAHIGFEAKLWLAADKLRSNMDAAEYKHVVLGLIFLNYISDSFEELPWFERIDVNCTLTTLRDTLLPKLLSGELSVAEVDF